jgi:hypothetical protein
MRSHHHRRNSVITTNAPNAIARRWIEAIELITTNNSQSGELLKADRRDVGPFAGVGRELTPDPLPPSCSSTDRSSGCLPDCTHLRDSWSAQVGRR